ncbi:MAG: homoserine kinase [Deltaproteobacteria bacterium]|nr:homoserine kinase [Deltaproteobacteria bacterium]
MRIKAPATSANLGAGFDVFGLALKEPYDLVEVTRIPEKNVRIKLVEGYEIPLEPEENTGGYVALRMIEDFDLPEGIELRIWKRIKPKSGLGSSAATAAAAAYALNKLFNLGLSREKLVEYAALGELISAGSPHPDNVASAIYGGFTMILSRNPLKIYAVDPPADLGVVIVLPVVEKASTKKAREILPKMIELERYVYNVGMAASLVAGMSLGNIEMIKEGMNDLVVEPIRAKAGIISEYEEVKELGRRLNAGIAVSGAGPAIIGVIEKERRKVLAKELERLYTSKGYRCRVYITEPGPGVSELEE